jgi:uncharacterized protein DUF4124
MRRVLPLIGLMMVLLVCTSSEATVYSWRDENGTLHFANDADAVPSDPAGGVRTFTAKTPTRPAPSLADGGGRVADRSADPPVDYERGLAAGLQIGEEQLRAAVDLAQSARAPAPQAPVYVTVPYAPPRPEVSVGIVRAPDGPFNDFAPGNVDYAFDYPYDPYLYWPLGGPIPAFGFVDTGRHLHDKTHHHHEGPVVIPGGRSSLSRVGPGLSTGWMGR